MTGSGGDELIPERQPQAATSVGFRLSIVLGLALLPLFVLTVAQNRSLSRQATTQLETSLMGQTVSAAQPEIDAIRSARVMSAMLSRAMPDVIDDVDACSRLMQRIKSGDSRVSVAGFVPASGQMVCASNGAPYDFSRSDNFRKMLENPTSIVSVAQNGLISKEPVITSSHTLFDQKGAFLGWAFVSIPHRLVPGSNGTASGVPPSGTEEGVAAAFLTFDRAGKILTSTVGLDQAPGLVPRGVTLADLARTTSRTFTASPPDEPMRTYAIVPLSEGSLFLLGTWPGDRMQKVNQLSKVGYVLPALIWLTCVLCARLISDHSVTRHIGAMRNAMKSFAGGRRTLVPLNLSAAPAELRDLGQSFTDMAERLLKDEAELENMLHQRDVLLREVHHRVKNNLQLMASMMNLQIRHAQSEETKEMMRAVQERVMNLAVIHRELYLTTGEMEIRVRELLGQMVSRVTRLGRSNARGITVTTQIDDITVTPDQAIALSLVVNECLTSALGRGAAKGDGSSAGEIAEVAVSLLRTADDRAALPTGKRTDANSGSDLPAPRSEENARLEILIRAPEAASPPSGPDGLSTMLIVSFARQLGSEAQSATEGSTYRLSIDFGRTIPEVRPSGVAAGPFTLSERSPATAPHSDRFSQSAG